MNKIRVFLNVIFIIIFICLFTKFAINFGNDYLHNKQKSMNILTSSEVLDIVYNDLDVQEDEVSGLNVELTDNKNQYNITFNVNETLYEFKVHSTTGIILDSNK